MKEKAEKLTLGSHVALKALLNERWLLVDATFGGQYRNLGFTVNEWAGKSDTKLAVEPVGELKEFDSLRKMDEYIERLHDKKPDKKEREEYFREFNEWLSSTVDSKNL